MKRKLYLIRGLPGSGKTTLANDLNTFVCEADQFFMVDGEYKYNSACIKYAHEFCQKKVESAMQIGYNSIAVSNTFSRKWEMEHYIGLANQYDYDVVEITMRDHCYANTHNVPEETIKSMRERWEK